MLDQLQKAFQAYLLHEDNAIQDDIVASSQAPVRVRLNIYRDAYYLRLLEALRQDYSVLQAFMGDEQFNELGRCYIDVHPSKFRSVSCFGKELANFMQHTQAYLKQAWLAEMAEFEWLLSEAFAAEDSSIVTIDEVAVIPHEKWPHLRFQCHPSLHKINLHWNIPSVWQQLKEIQYFDTRGMNLRASTQGENRDSPLKKPHRVGNPAACHGVFDVNKIKLSLQKTEEMSWVIWRKVYDVHFCSLAVPDAAMIDAIKANQPLSAICETLCNWINEEQVAAYAATLLKRFILDGLITKICL